METISNLNIDAEDAQIDNQSSPQSVIQSNYGYVIRTFKIKGRDYKYNGPENKETKQLLQLLEDMERNEQINESELGKGLGKIILNYNLINNWVLSKCSFLRNRVQIDIADILIFIFYWIIYFITIGESVNLNINNTVSSQIAQKLPIYSVLYTLGSLSCQQTKKFYLWILLFIGILVIPIFLILYFFLDIFHTQDIKDYNYSGIGFCIVTIMIFFHSLLNSLLLSYVKEITTKLYAAIVNCSFCFLISYLIIFKTICFILVLDSTDIVFIINNIKDIIKIPVGIGLLSLSIILLIGLFKQAPQQIFSDLRRLQQISIPNDEIIEAYKNYYWEGKFQRSLEKLKLKYVSPILVSICYLVAQYYCYAQVIAEMSQSQMDFGNIITYSGLLGYIIIFFVLGILISNTNLQIDLLYLRVPLIFGGILTFINVKVWTLTYQIQYLEQISGLINICSLMISLTWLSIGYFRSERRNQKLFMMVWCCLFFAFPFALLFTISDQNTQITICAKVFISIGFIPLIGIVIYYAIVIVIYLIKLPEQAKTINFQAYKHINLNSYAHLVNSFGYIVGFYFLCHVVWNESVIATSIKKGTVISILFQVIGIIVVQTILFYLINYALQINALKKPLPANSEEKNLYERYLNRIKQMIKMWSIISFIVLLPLSLTRDDETQKTSILVCSIVIPIGFQYLHLLFKIKLTLPQYQDFTQPLVIIFMWIFVIGPIGIVFPILSNMYESSSKEFAAFAQIAVAYSIFLIILIVTGASIFYSVLLNKEFLEMKKKEVLTAVIQKLEQNQVQATEEVCSIIFIRYIQQQMEDKLKDELKEGTLVNVMKYEGPEKRYLLELLSKDDFDAKQQIQKQRAKAQSKRGKQISQAQSDTETIQDQQEIFQEKILVQIQNLLLDLLTCEYGQKQLLNLADRQKQVEIENASVEQWKQSKLEGANLQIPNDQFLSKLSKNDFYKYLLNHDERSERFWCALHSKFQKHFEIILEFLDYIPEDQVLSQYQSFQKEHKTFSISISLSDFADILKDNTPVTESKYEYLWQLAIKKFPIFLYNFPDLKPLLRQQHQGTPFCKQKYQEERKNKLKKLIVFQQIEGNNDYIEKECQNRKNIIQQLFAQDNPGQIKLKFWKICETTHLFLWVRPQEIMQKIYEGVVERLSINQIRRILPDEDKIEKNPIWEKLSQEIGDLIIYQCKKFDTKMKDQKYEFKISSTNIIAVMFKVLDWYGLATLAFSSQVGWIDAQEFNPITTVDYQVIWNNYDLFFAVALALSIAYIILGIQANKQIQNNTFGYNSQGEIATISDLNFYISKSISIISGQFIFVMKTFIDAFICNYDSYPYKLMRQPSVECMSNIHFMYGVLALIGCGLFYPLSTFLQPAFQYSDHSLDLKYKSSYVALFIQAKLLLLGLSTVFSNLHEQAYLYQMLFSGLVMVLLIYAYHKIQPCYIVWFNLIEICFLFLLCFLYFSAFLIMATKTRLVGIIFLSLGISITTPYYGYRIFKYYRRNQNQATTKVIYVSPSHLEESRNLTGGNE